MNRQRVRAVIRKDWLEVRRNTQVVGSLVAVPLVFAVVIPAAVALLGSSTVLTTSINGMQSFLDHLPTGVVPPDLTDAQTVVYAVLVYFMAPFFLVIPVMVASITASSSFVGEKERGTIEGLLYTPLTNRELVMGKVLGSLIPSVALTWISFVAYTAVACTLGARAVGRQFFPTWSWAVLVVALVPLIGFLATALIVAVSGRSTTMQGAQGTAMFIVFPILALIVGQATGLMLVDIAAVLVAVPVLLVIDAVAFVLVVGRFDRERVVTRL